MKQSNASVEEILAKKQKDAKAAVDLVMFIEGWCKECGLDNGEAALILIREGHEILSKMCEIKNRRLKGP